MIDSRGYKIYEVNNKYGISFSIIKGFYIILLKPLRTLKKSLNITEVYDYLVDIKNCSPWEIECTIERLKNEEINH